MYVLKHLLYSSLGWKFLILKLDFAQDFNYFSPKRIKKRWPGRWDWKNRTGNTNWTACVVQFLFLLGPFGSSNNDVTYILTIFDNSCHTTLYKGLCAVLTESLAPSHLRVWRHLLMSPFRALSLLYTESLGFSYIALSFLRLQKKLGKSRGVNITNIYEQLCHYNI